MPRAGDIVVSTPPKSGTTWVQAILAMLIAGDPDVGAQISMKSPWIDINIRDLGEVMARLEAQDHRRQVKTHTPFDGIPFWQHIRYVTVYRHPIDVHFSYRKHLANMARDVGQAPLSENPSDSFREFLAEDVDHRGLGPILDHYLCTLAREPREALIRLHYADMLRDLPGAVASLAAHVGIAHPAELMAAITKAATFASMKANADRFTPSAGQGFWKADAGFFDSATSKKWEGQLTAGDLAAYDAKLDAVLSAGERAWLEWGGAPRR
ncbi:MAG: sulfotransferase domain-containing protein [Paracoccaceae bacterium]